MRIEPPPSLASASGTMPAATAAAAPPLEPPVLRAGSQGFRARAERERLGGGQQAELRRVGLAEHDEPGGLAARHERLRARRDAVEEQPRALRAAHAFPVGEVLQQIGDAREGPLSGSCAARQRAVEASA